jgi:6-phosphogluconolactonase
VSSVEPSSVGTDEPELVVLPDPEACARVVASAIIDGLGAAIATRGVAHWATTGGSTPAGIYREVVGPEFRDRVDWRRVHVWWGDDRFVPRRDLLSNVLDVDAILRAPDIGVGIPPANVHPIPVDEALHGGHGPDWAAARYAEELRSAGPAASGTGAAAPGEWPAFDIVLLGMGPDGHVLSVFPESAAWDAPDVVLPVPAPTHVEPHVPRVTLHPSVLDAAADLLMVVWGAAKAGILATVLGPLREERRWPAQRARRAGATWIVDAAAAAGLSDERGVA